VVDPGDAEQGPALDRLYSKLGIPHLRDAYTVKPDRSGREVGPQMAEAVVSFRALLRGLAAVLPRLRAARPRWEEEGEWLEQSRLSHFMNAGTIRVLDQLRLTYELPGVASVAVEAAAAYDPMGHELLLSASAVAQPSLHAVALAEGLLELIYQGPASEGLIDLLNLLIPLGHRQAMDAYLDRRHFPQALSQGQAPGLSERLGEIMDYGLHKLLERRFSELAGQDWAVWRQGDLRLQGDPEAAAQKLCRALGQQSPSAELLQTLRQLLAAPTLEEAVGDLWEPATLGSDLRRHDTAAFPAADLDPTDASPGEDRPPGGTTATRAARGSLAQGGAPESAQESASTTGGSHSQAGGGRVTPGPPAAMVTAEGTPGVLASVGQKMLSRLGQWLGVQPQQKVQVLGLRLQLPDVAESYRNPPERHLLVSSKALRGHDLYCPAWLGIDFDPRRQIYLPGEVPWLRSFESSGRTLEFSGRLSNAEDPLPMPLYSRLSQPPRIKGGGRATLRGADRMGQYRLTLEDPAAELSYAIELGMLPEPQGQLLPEQIDPRWLKPTAPLNALPPLVLEWISWARSCGLEPAPLARQARDFIISHYIYDKAFLQNPEMLELGRQPVRGDENRILTLLHAGATGRYLGRGVCLELSALLLEMLRRARIPAVLAGVWMLDMGLLHTPDHSIVLACMPGPRGPFWLPLDPSQSRTATAPAQEAPEPTRADLLQAACDLVLGPSFAPPGEPAVREQAQEEALLGALGSRRRLEALLESIARSGRYLREVDSELQWLAARGYLRVDKEELYRVSPRPRGFS
jgi:transglutaminase-like putative cysteine protease